MSTNKGGIVKQSGNDVEGYRSQKVLFQPSVRVFLQYSVKPGLHISRKDRKQGLRTCFSSSKAMVWSPCCSNDRKY